MTSTLGGYTVLDELGSGGMGAVHVATAPGGIRVALKIIHPHLVSKPDVRARFRREVEIGRRIQHENVVATLDAGETDSGGKPALFLAMELVEGQTLRALLGELGRVPEELCRHVGREIARGLAAIHAAGVCHRDLKPENVLITPAQQVKIMDLGVALLADESLRLSRSGEFVGSVLYAAPEQFGAARSDARGDLYALGLLLYELATGEHPFQGDDVATVIHKQIHDAPRPPADVNPQLSPFFEEVLNVLLAKDPAERFAEAGDVLAALDEGEDSAWWQTRAQAIRSETARPLRRIRIPRDAPLHGRQAELDRLERLYREASEGEGRVVFIEGEAGIGKTRLVDEFVARLRRAGEELHFLFGSYPPGGAATAAGAFSTAYREHFGSEGLTEQLQLYLPERSNLVPAFAALLRGEAPPAGSAPFTKDSLLSVFVRTTAALAAELPTVLVVEDLHFAPEAGRAIFAALAAAAPDHRLLVIGTARPGLPEEWLTGIERLDHAARITLPRLTPKELSHLLRDVFRSERLAEELGWQIAIKSDGNPFFLFEIVRGLREESLIERGVDGTWVRTQHIDEVRVPSSVLDLVDARIQDLDEHDKDLLEVAACCGFEFDPLLVAAALGMEQIPAMKRLAHMEKKHRLVRAAGRRYVFDHHQVQEALYRGLPQLLREPYHAALAEALERRHGSEPSGDVAVEICEHFLNGAQAARARSYLPTAMEHLRDGYLHDVAIGLADRALAGAGALEGVDRVEVLLAKAESLEMRARHDEGQATLEEALTLADDAADPALQAGVRRRLGRLLIWKSEYDAARQRLQEALDLARAAGDEPLELAARGNLGVVLYRTRRFDEAQRIFEDARVIARRLEDRRTILAAEVNLANIHWCRGEFEDARGGYERYRKLSRELGYRDGEALGTGNLGNVAWARGLVAEAAGHYREVLDLATAIGDEHKVALFSIRLGEMRRVAGWFEEARELMNSSLELTKRIGMPREESSALLGLAEVAQSEGDLAEAERLVDQAGACRAASDTGAYTLALLARARLADTRGQRADAARLFDELAAAARAEPETWEEVIALAGRAAASGGGADEAEARLREREEKLPMHVRLHAHRFLARATGDPEHAAAVGRLAAHFRDHLGEPGPDIGKVALLRSAG